ncbi:craniofacial development protein 2-like [Palaemon carinicauda]|uniref:craniofacial development protein 2-like n=1 Tax=Palaemon carinicauda TaxID=392227 RepID=UPI0035B5A729
MKGRNGVGITLSKDLKVSLLGVNRKNDRIMSLNLELGATIVNVVCAYALQTGCTAEEKDAFWEEMDQELRIIPARERVIIGDLNGHLGISREGIERVHGSWGVGERNDGGEKVIDFAVAFDLAMINTFFEKRINRLIIYSSSGRESQIDLQLCKRDHLTEVRNCKVINGESVAAQHRSGWVDGGLEGGEQAVHEGIDFGHQVLHGQNIDIGDSSAYRFGLAHRCVEAKKTSKASSVWQSNLWH